MEQRARMLNADLTALEQDIPIGKDSAISRKQLSKLWGVNDRTAREIIAKMRADGEGGDGYVIVSFSSGDGGYYRTNDRDEILHFVNEMTNRARSTFLSIRRARRALADVESKTTSKEA
jgi:hypothetical protein